MEERSPLHPRRLDSGGPIVARSAATGSPWSDIRNGTRGGGCGARENGKPPDAGWIRRVSCELAGLFRFLYRKNSKLAACSTNAILSPRQGRKSACHGCKPVDRDLSISRF
jgi:hypothetical protein